MKDALKPYPAYKDSGLQWFGKTPEHWSLLPNRATFFEIKQRGFAEEEMLSVTINRGVIRQSSLLSQTSKKDSSNEDKSKYKLVCPNDIAYNKMRAWQGAVGVSEYRGIVSPAYIVMRPRQKQISKYFHYLFRTQGFSNEAERWSYGITSDQWSLRPEEFKNIYCCVPSIPEQTAIVRYLDYMDRRIKLYINAKKKLIALLNEQKQAIIQQAVTRGLDPSVRLKPSGVDWLGEVPEHWEIRRVKNIYREVDERSITGNETHLSMSQKLGLVPNNLIEERRLISESYLGSKLCKINDLVLNRLKAHLGVFALAGQPGIVSPDYTVLRVFRPIVDQYFEYVLRTPCCRVELKKRTKGIIEGFWRLYSDDLFDIKIPEPPFNEQQNIVDYLHKNLKQTDETIDICRNEINLLKEYSTRLIADLVTGKLDVREAAASLPDESDQPELTTDSETVSDKDADAEEEPENTMPEAEDED